MPCIVTSPVANQDMKKRTEQFRFVLFLFGADNRTCSERSERNSETGEFIRGSDRLRSTICCKQQCYAFARQIAQSLAMSAALDFRKCKRLLLSSLAVSCVQGHTKCADNALHCHKSCCKPRYEKTNRIISVRFCLFWCGQQDLNLHSLATIRT